MAKKYFFFMYPSQVEVRSLLNMAIYCLDTSEKWPAHITVAGPYYNRPKERALFDGDASVFSLGVGNFFAQGISTVFLRVGVQNIWSVWRKPDFLGNPVPHLTLYNGRDRALAEDIYSRLQSLSLFFSFRSSGLTLVSSESGQQVMTLREQLDVNVHELTANLRIDDIKILPWEDRLKVAVDCLRRCASLNNHQPSGNAFTIGKI